MKLSPRRSLAAALALGFLLALVLWIAFGRIGGNTDQIEATQRTAYEAALGQCRRVQKLREHFNASQRDRFDSSVQAVGREVALAATGARATHLRSARQIAGRANRIVIEPVTDCREAIERPLTYSAGQGHTAGRIRVRAGRASVNVGGHAMNVRAPAATAPVRIVRGPPGVRGEQGLRGKPGRRGRAGRNGRPGRDGAPGKAAPLPSLGELQRLCQTSPTLCSIPPLH